MEPVICNALARKKEGKSLDTRKSLHVHSKRKRLADPDGISCKAVIDGLRKAGVLIDDNAECVEEVSYSQETSEHEETVIVIKAIK